MPLNRTPSIRYSPSGEAAAREQRRNADLDRDERNKQLPVIFVKTYGFRPYYNFNDNINIKGPLCPGSLTKDRQCLSPLTIENELATKARCEVCSRNYDMPHNCREFIGIAQRAYEGFVHSQAQLITLDLPYEAVKAEQEDKTRWVKVVWSQKDGRNQAIIYFINKGEGGAKAQVFADMEHEEIRYDADDIPPGTLLAKIKAEFKNTIIEVQYDKSDKPEQTQNFNNKENSVNN